MTLEEFIAARIGTRFFEVAPRGRLTHEGKRRGKSKAIGQKAYDGLKQAWERGEEPGDRLSRPDLALLKILAATDTKCIEVWPERHIIWANSKPPLKSKRAYTVRRDRLKKWQRCGVIEPEQPALFKGVAASYKLTPKGERIGKAAPNA
jgi:hypothetical protein